MKPNPSIDQAAARRSRWKGVCRGCFRGLRISLLLAVFAVVVTAFFVNKIGLPEFLKQRLVDQARAKGWEIEFSRVRLRWDRGIVADDLHLRRTNGLRGPNLFVQRAECGLNFNAFTQLKLDVRSFRLTGGRLVWPPGNPDEPRRAFALNNVNGELRFLPNDEWRLRSLHGELLGARVRFVGTVTNGSLIRDWQVGKPKRRPRRPAEDLWEDLVRTVTQIQFAERPELEGSFRGDAADLRSFDATMICKVPGVASPWGAGTNILITARLVPGATSNDVGQVDLSLSLEQARTRWAEAAELRINMEAEPRYTRAWPSNANLTVELKGAKSPWATSEYALITSKMRPCSTNTSLLDTDMKVLLRNMRSGKHAATSSEIKLLVTHPFTNTLPASVSGSGQLARVTTEWGNASTLHFKLAGTAPETTNLSLFNTNMTWPERLKALPFISQVAITNLNGGRVAASAITVDTQWAWPSVRANVEGTLYGGQFAAKAQIDVETRDVLFDGATSFDVHRIAPLLSTNAQKFLRSYSWQKPPQLQASGRVTLPEWTNFPGGFGAETLASLSVAGSFKVGHGAYKGVTFNSAEAPFRYTNEIWRIDRLLLKRPEGSLVGDYTSKPATKQFHWKLRSEVDPNAFRPLFTKEAEQRAFGMFEFTSPPVVEGEVWGNWRKPENFGAVAKVAAKNLRFRGETVSECSTDLIYTNFFLSLLNPQLQRPNEKGAAPGIGIDFRELRVWFTNAFGNLNPQAVARCIGRKTGQVMEDYIFDASPTIRLNGSVDLKKGSDEDDLHFEISGGTFHWKQFNFQQIAGNIDWVGRTMVLTNAQGIFHGGRAVGHARFAFPRKKGTDFSFRISIAEVDFNSLMADLSSKSNKLEGMLNGELTVLSANSEQPDSWLGYGNINLRDGLIWDIPVFGLFSPILNAFVPGLGNSRAKQGTANFLITNSIISTRDLEIRATAMRMHFQGTVDFEKRLDSRMEAELLRDMPGIGVVISKIFWPVTKIFEYRVTGTLAQPRAEPLYIVPKILLLPLQPIKTLKDIIEQEAPEPPPDKPPESKPKAE